MMLFSVQQEAEVLRTALLGALKRVVDSARFVGGPEVEAFEAEFASFCATHFCAGCSSGTDALIAALWALGVGHGDEVILPAFTFTATAEAVALLGARPVFVDINSEGDYNLNPSAVEAAITPRTAAVIAVHLYGIPADMAALRRICSRHGLVLVEDAAQAHGSRLDGAPVGSLGDAGCFSFYPTKNLGALGDAGAVTTNDPEVVRRVRLFLNHGRKTHTEHVAVGCNGRLDALQAVVLRVKLRHLDGWMERRRYIRCLYEELLADVAGVRLRRPPDGCQVAWHLMVVEVEERDALLEALTERGVACGVHYPCPLHLMPAWAYLGYREGEFPEAERAARTVLSLPVHQFLTEADVERVCRALSFCVG